MSVKDILVAAFNKDASSFETAFSSVMKEKVSAAVENRFFAAEEYELDEAKDEDEEDEDEEDDEDELDEESKPNQYIQVIDKRFGNKEYHEVHPTKAFAALNHFKSLPHVKSAGIISGKEAEGIKASKMKKEEVELDEKKLTAKDVKHALASAKAKPKETVSLKKPPFKMEEVELDEVSASTLGSYIRKATKAADAAYKSREDAIDNDDGETARKMGRLARKRDKGADMAMDKLKGTRYAKVHATEEVDYNEASE